VGKVDPDTLTSMWAQPPRFEGEGEFALWHFSENPELSRFEPHVAATSNHLEPLVWAIDTRHSPHFWFPRDCPRGCVWLSPTTTDEDRDRFFGHSAATRLHVIESAWAEQMVVCQLHAYRMPVSAFASIDDQAAGYWISREPVEAVDRIEIGNLIQRHAKAGIELRITPDIWPFWHSVSSSTLSFSGSRLRNASRPEPPRV
jgi:hypothetical protein